MYLQKQASYLLYSPSYLVSRFYNAASSPTIATPSPRPAPADWKGAAAVLAAVAALRDAEAEDEAEAEADEAEAAPAEPEAEADDEAEAEAEAEADEPEEGQVGLVLSSTPEPLHRAVARLMVSEGDQRCKAFGTCFYSLSLSAWLQVLRTQQAMLVMALLLQIQATSAKLQDPTLLPKQSCWGRVSGRLSGVAMATYGTFREPALETLRQDCGAESSQGSEDGEAHDGGEADMGL
jgi:hypothetical protein